MGTKTDRKGGLSGYQGLFLALTLIVIIIIILLVRDLTTAILVIGLITNFLIISSQLTLIKGRNMDDEVISAADRLAETDFDDLGDGATTEECTTDFCPLKGKGKKEGFDPLPGAYPPYIESYGEMYDGAYGDQAPALPSRGWQPALPSGGYGAPGAYPGSIDNAVLEIALDTDTSAEHFPWGGHTDRYAADTAYAPEGNPYDLDRAGNPIAAGPCIDDDAVGELLDGDERMAYQVRSRNDETRVIAGTMKRKEFLQRFLGEEVQEAEDREWWGRHEI